MIQLSYTSLSKALSEVLLGSPEFRISKAETLSTQTLFQQMQHRRIFVHMCTVLSSLPELQISKKTHIFDRYSTGAHWHTCAQSCPLTWDWACLTKFTSEGYFLENLQSNSIPFLDWTRKTTWSCSRGGLNIFSIFQINIFNDYLTAFFWLREICLPVLPFTLRKSSPLRAKLGTPVQF